MKTKYKYIHFEKIDDWWLCRNNRSNDELGRLDYYKRWKEWVFESERGCVFNNSCLRDIADFLDQLNAERTRKWLA